VVILPPDINRSELKFSVEPLPGVTSPLKPLNSSRGQLAMRFGLIGVKNVGEGAIQSMIAEREANGPFKSLQDFCKRVDLRAINKRVVESLIKCGAMDGFGDRGQLLKGLDQTLDAAALTLIKIYKDKYSSISISMDIADTEKIFNKIAERELDIGIVGGWINNRKVDGFQWLEDELVAIIPENHRLAENQEIKLGSLLSERWIFRERGSGTRKAVEELLNAHGINKEELNIYMEAGSTEAVLAMVEAGMGISIVSRWAIKRIEQRKMKSIKLDEIDAKRFLYIIYPRQKIRRKTVNNFLEYLKILKESNQE
jgi:DNA polymerase III alpha subunit